MGRLPGEALAMARRQPDHRHGPEPLLANHPAYEWVDLREDLSELKRARDEDEAERFALACCIADPSNASGRTLPGFMDDEIPF